MASRLTPVRSLITSPSPRYLSTITATAKAVTRKGEGGTLYSELMMDSQNDNDVTVTLNKWVKEGKFIKKWEIISFARELRKSKKHDQAMEIYAWMEKEFKMSNDDCAVWISLLAKSEGLASAEKYFDSLEKSAKTRKTYGALLNCYCDDKNLEKASNLFEKMKEANAVKRGNIFSYATLLRKLKKYDQAKQMYEWIEKNDKLTKADHAIRLDILSKTKGSAKAEKYFDRLEGSSKNKKTYGSLLNYYCKGKKLDKSLNLFEEMKELNYASTTNYNRMLNLYLNMGQPEKVMLLAEEMEENNITADSYTYTQLLRSYASVEDLNAVEKVIKKMKTNDVKCDWFIFGNIATIYANAGLFEKANAALRDMEEFENLRDLEAFHTLITLYAKTSNVSGVKRSWDSLKVVFPKPKNVSYLIVLLAFSKLGEVDALEKYFIDWETDCSEYDVRIANVILKSYLKRDMIEKAELVYDNMMRTGAEPSLTTYETLTNYYLKKGQIDLALKFLDVGELKAKQWKRNWFPTDEIIKMFVRYFEDENDVEKAEKFCNCLKMIDRLNSTIYGSIYGKLES